MEQELTAAPAGQPAVTIHTDEPSGTTASTGPGSGTAAHRAPPSWLANSAGP
jgi:hypothetical protein